MESVFLVWKGYQARVESMSDFFGYDSLYLRNRYHYKIFRLVDYIHKFIRTIAYLRLNQPRLIWVQLPPTPLVYLVYLYSVRDKDVRIIWDCHNGLFRAPWVKSPFMIKILNKSNSVVVVHNRTVLKTALDLGLSGTKLCVLEDRPTNVRTKDIPKVSDVYNVVFPASFSQDEPIDLVLEAARELGSVQFAITGDYRRWRSLRRANIPDNVHLTGWLSPTQFNGILTSCNVILGLTKHQDVQLSVANEAVGFVKPMVLSDTPVLRQLFPCAVHVKHDVSSLLTGLSYALSHEEALKANVQALKHARNDGWVRQANELISTLAT